MRSFFFKLFFFCIVLSPPFQREGKSQTLPPAVVGLSNLLLPGAGALIDGDGWGFGIEAATEIGLYAAGSVGVPQGPFTIDGTAVLPASGDPSWAILGTMFQQAGLKLHMYDTFRHYQKAAKVMGETGGRQPLYRGSAGDILAAPFQGKYMGSPWVYSLIALSAAYLAYSYHTSPVSAVPAVSGGANSLYGVAQIGVIPLGSAFGEEALFRGFMQREIVQQTDSIVIALLAPSILFGALHPPGYQLSAFLSGLYFGGLTLAQEGDLGYAIAAHFWIDVADGIVTLLSYLASQGQDPPWAPPVNFSLAVRY